MPKVSTAHVAEECITSFEMSMAGNIHLEKLRFAYCSELKGLRP